MALSLVLAVLTLAPSEGQQRAQTLREPPGRHRRSARKFCRDENAGELRLGRHGRMPTLGRLHIGSGNRKRKDGS